MYNYRLSRARRVLENTFGIIVARMILLGSPIRAAKENIIRYVMAAIFLHNYVR